MMYVCMYVCVCVYEIVYVHVYIFMYICMYVHVGIICMNMDVRVCYIADRDLWVVSVTATQKMSMT